MIERIEREYKFFHSRIKRLKEHGYHVEEEIADGYIISPRRGGDVMLTMMGITHGDEVAGMAVLNEVVAYLTSNVVRLRHGLALILGNIKATREGSRFYDRDLNRCYDVSEAKDDGTHELARASEISRVLSRTGYLIDFHQTTARCASCFSIFPYTKENFSLAQKVNEGNPIVARWGERFSAEGMCSDEYVNKCGGVAITVELGRKGFSPWQIAQGAAIAVRALCMVNGEEKYARRKRYPSLVLTPSQVIPHKKGCELVSGFYNFKKVEEGGKLATFNGGFLNAEEEGWILFPKYEWKKNRPPSELCHVLTRVPAEKYRSM